MRQDIRFARVGPPLPPSLRLEFAASSSKDLVLVNCVGLTPLLFFVSHLQAERTAR
jgi:hypothetical protein